ncbi:MAG TPA: oligosaccharide flippase family protein [Pyrinomonadaceae bacterium]|jgi:O-antigen/teichoic acid export membrane protein
MTTAAEKKGTSLTAGAFLIVFAKTLAFAFSFALPLLLVRRLTQHDLGLYKQAFLVVGTATAIFSLNFNTSAYYFLPRERGRGGAIVLNVLIFNLVAGGLALTLLTLFPGLLERIFNSPDLVGYAPLIGVVILLWIFSLFLEIVAIAHQELRAATVFIVVAQFSKTALMLGATLWFTSVRALLYAAAVQGLLQTVLLVCYLRSRFPGFWRGFRWPSMRGQLAYALPLGLYGLLWTFQVDLHNYFVSHRFGAEAFALYAMGCFDLPLIGILGESVGAVMIPRVSQLQKEGNAREILVVTARAMRKLAAAYFPIYAFLMVIGREFITLLFTAQYLGSWPIFAVSITLIPFNILTLDPLTRAYGEHRFYLLRVRGVMLVAQTAALWFAVGRFGLVGAIGVVVAGTLAERFVLALKFGRVLGVGWGDARLLKDVGKVAAATVAAAAVAVAVRALTAGARPFFVIACCGVAFSLAYVGGLLALGVPEQDERDAARRWLTRLRALLPRRRKVGETLA